MIKNKKTTLIPTGSMRPIVLAAGLLLGTVISQAMIYPPGPGSPGLPQGSCPASQLPPWGVANSNAVQWGCYSAGKFPSGVYACCEYTVFQNKSDLSEYWTYWIPDDGGPCGEYTNAYPPEPPFSCPHYIGTGPYIPPSQGS